MLMALMLEVLHDLLDIPVSIVGFPTCETSGY